MVKSTNLQTTILDTALQLAEKKSWEALRLHDVATELDITLNQIREYFPQKDDLVEAWYDQADSAMLRTAADPDFLQLDMQARLHRVIMSWLDALAIHKKVSRDMLWYKLEPGHIHLQVLGILRISRTVQWFRETAHQDSTHLLRVLEEIGLTSIYLATFVYWMNDTSENQQRTRNFLQRKLKRAGRCATTVQDWFGIQEPGKSRTTKS